MGMDGAAPPGSITTARARSNTAVEKARPRSLHYHDGVAGPRRLRPNARSLTLGAAIAVAYAVSAQLGFRVAFVAEQITTVWPPTGIALAALLLGGLRFWPAVWAGAFLANAGSEAPLWTAFVLAAGTTLEAVLAAWGLRRRPSVHDGI